MSEEIKSVWLKDPITEEKLAPRTFTQLIQDEKGENLETRLAEKEKKIERISYQETSTDYGFNVETVKIEEIFNLLERGDTFIILYNKLTHLGLAEYVTKTINNQYGYLKIEKFNKGLMKIEFLTYGSSSIDSQKIYEGYITYVNNKLKIIDLKLKAAGTLSFYDSIDQANTGLQWFHTNTSTISGIANAVPTAGQRYHIIRANHDTDTTHFVDFALPYFLANNAAFRQIVDGTDNGWRYFLDSKNYNTWAAQKIVQGGNYTKGYIRFPDVKKQICWTNVTAKAAFTTAWGNCYEFHDGNGINLGNWQANFSATPSVVYNVSCNSQNAGMWVNTYQKPTTSHAGIVNAVRPNSYSTSVELRFTAIGIGNYS